VRVARRESIEQLERRLARDEPHRKCSLQSEAAKEIGLETDHVAIRTREVDDRTRTDQHDEFLQVLRRAQRLVARGRRLGDVITPHPCAGRNEQARAGQDDEEA
jgi:hypothetical protein